MVLENEIEIEKASGTVLDKDGLLPISVSYDMQWLKWGSANDSLTGHGALMGSKTKKVIDFASVNKFCRICESANSNGVEPNEHDCRLSHKKLFKINGSGSGSEAFQRNAKLWYKILSVYWRRQ